MFKKVKYGVLSETTPQTKHGLENELSKIPGCYCVEHVASGKVYTGSTGNLAKRISTTTSSLNKNMHKNVNLQKLYNENKELKFYVAPTKDVDMAGKLEQSVVDALKNTDLLCNVAVINVLKTAQGRVLSDKHKEILRKSNMNRIVSDETRKRQSEAKLQFDKTEAGRILAEKKVSAIERKVEIEGTQYKSISEASRQLKIPYTSLVKKYNIKPKHSS